MRTIDICVTTASQGGMENVINQTACFLQQHSYHVRIVQMFWGGKEWADSELEFFCLNDWKMPIPWDSVIESYINFIEKYGSPDCIVSTGWPILVLVLKQAILKSGCQCTFVGWPHGIPSHYEKDGVGGAECYKYAEAVFVISKMIGQELKDKGIMTPQIRVCNPIDTTGLVYSAKREKENLCFIGRISPEKNLPYIIEAISKSKHPYHLFVVGDGDVEGAKIICEKYCVEKAVTFLGWLNNPWRELKNVGMLVLASDFEGFGLVTVEALLCGVPVLSKSTGIAAELIHAGENGYYYGGDSGLELVDLLDRIGDGTLPFPKSENCRESVKQYQSEYALADFERKLRDVIL